MIISDKVVWVIMTKDRKYIAKGTPRNRYLIPIEDTKNTKRYLTYSSKGRAEAGFKLSGFYGIPYNLYAINDFEAIPVQMIMTTIEKDKV